MWQDKALAGVAFIFVIFGIFFITDQRIVGWDESVYIGMGKYMTSFGSAGLWEDIRPPALPLLLGIEWKLGIPYGIVPLFFGLATIVLLYIFFRQEHPTLGLLASLLYVASPLVVEHSYLTLTHVPAAFFVLLAALIYTKHHSFFVGCCVGIATLFRFPLGLELVAFGLLYLYKQKYRDVLFLLFGFSAFIIPFFIFNVFMYGTITSSLLDAALRPFIFASTHQSNPFHSGSFYFYIVELVSLNAVFLCALFTRKKDVAILALLPLLYFSLIANKQSRFLLDILPLIVLLSADGIARIYRSAKYLRLAPVFVCVLLILQVLSLTHLSFPSRWHDDKLLSFFQSFDTLPSPTVTTTPLPAAYSNHLFLPIYDNPDVALQLYPRFAEGAHYVLYTDDFYPCVDEECQFKKEVLYDTIKKNELVFNMTPFLLFQLK